MTQNRTSRRRVLAGAAGVAAVAAGLGGLSQALRPGRLLDPRRPTPTPSATSTTTPTSADTRHLVVIGEQSRREVLVLDADVTDWGSSDAVHWRWRQPRDWGKPGDVKLVDDAALGGRVLVISSQHHVAVVGYPGGRVHRRLALSPRAGVHTAELLPGGLLAVACTKLNRVRIYRLSNAGHAGVVDSSHYNEIDIRTPHGLYWDRNRQLLWILGNRRLMTVRVRPHGSSASTTVVGKNGLPADQPGGHDLTGSLGQPGLLLLTTAAGILGYDSRRHRFVAPSAGDTDLMTHAGARAVGDWPDGRLLWNGPPPHTRGVWRTDTVRLRNPAASRRLPDSTFYKSRPFVPAHI